MTDTPALYKMSLTSLSKQLKFGGPDQCRSCSGHLCGSAFRPLKGKSGPARRLCTRFIDPLSLAPFIHCRQIPLDKLQGFTLLALERVLGG